MSESTTTTTQDEMNPLILIDSLPDVFREVHGQRPRRFANHDEASQWLRLMEDQTLAYAARMLDFAERCASDDRSLEEAKQYLAAHHAIAALRERK